MKKIPYLIFLNCCYILLSLNKIQFDNSEKKCVLYLYIHIDLDTEHFKSVIFYNYLCL